MGQRRMIRPFTTQRCTTASGVAIAYDEWPGDGPVVIFLHATGFTRGVWRPHCEALLEQEGGRLHPVAVDLRGHGASDKPAPPYLWPAFVQDTIELIDQRGWRDVILCGHSVGGSTAVEVAAERPDLVNALVLLEAAVNPPREPAAAASPDGVPTLIERTLRRRYSWSSREEAAEYIRARQPYDAWDAAVFASFIDTGIVPAAAGGVELACPPEIEASVFKEAVGSRAWERLPAVACPTWIGRGAGDRGMPSTTSPLALAQLKHGTELVVDGPGHFAPLEDVAWTVGIVRSACQAVR